jgi:hypothetical protein
MAFIHGRVTFVSIDADDLSTYGTSVEFNRSADSHDVTTFGNTAHRKQSGLMDGGATINGIYDSTASTGPQAVLGPLVGGAAVELIYRPEGTGSSLPERTVDVIVTAYNESSPVADMVTWTAEVEFDGAVDLTAQSA